MLRLKLNINSTDQQLRRRLCKWPMEEDKGRDKYGMTHTDLRHLHLLVIREMEHLRVSTVLPSFPLAAQPLQVRDGPRSIHPQPRRAVAAVPK